MTKKMNIYEFETFCKKNPPESIMLLPQDDPDHECFGSCEIAMTFPEILVSTYNNCIFLKQYKDTKDGDYICFANIDYIEVYEKPECYGADFMLFCSESNRKYEYVLVALYPMTE